MNYKKIIIFTLFLFVTNCANNNFETRKNNKIRYSNKGFALIFDENLFKNKVVSKKIDNRSFLIYHKYLKSNSSVKIENLKNNKTLIAKVKSNRANFPLFFNSVISKRISEDLELDENDPYVEITLIVDNSSFVAKKSKTFEEEKNVAEKAPIDGITINDLNKSKNKKKLKKNKNFSYSIKVADFYYENTAQKMLEKIENQTSIKKKQIKMLSKTKFRVVLGPFNDIVSLEDSFNEIIEMGFENIEIINNV